MPILPPEPDLFPNNLLDDWPVESDEQSKWWALYTLARREKDLMRRLKAMNVGFYGPMCPRKNRSPSGRVRVSHVPLFSGYVFLCGSDEDRIKALTTNCISRTLSVNNASAFVSDLRNIRKLIESDAPLTPESRLEPGARVRVRNGPLQGVEGTVIQRRGKERLLVAVKFLQQGASVALEDFRVEPLD